LGLGAQHRSTSHNQIQSKALVNIFLPKNRQGIKSRSMSSRFFNRISGRFAFLGNRQGQGVTKGVTKTPQKTKEERSAEAKTKKAKR
jgi:hypothetical protein